MTRLFSLTLLTLSILFFSTPLEAQKYPQKASPFDEVRWKNNQPEVRIDETWYSPISVDGVEVSKIIAACEKRWRGQLQKRFTEDLMEALSLLNHRCGDKVSLRLTLLENGKVKVLEYVPNTREKRNKLRDDRNRESGSPIPLRKPPEWLSREQIRSEIEFFKASLRDQFAYLHLKGIQLDSAIEAEIKSRFSEGLPEKLHTFELATILHTVLMRFGDGHAQVRSDFHRPDRASLYTPFLLGESDFGIVAFLPDRSSFLDSKHPVIVEIDGIPIDEIVARLAPLIADGSSQLKRSRALRLIRSVSLWRFVEEFPKSPLGADFNFLKTPFEVKLQSLDGKKTKALSVTPTDLRPIYGNWPAGDSRILSEKLGYLRIPKMNGEAVREIRESMQRFNKTRGLIIDVRGNGGGSREALITLAGYLVDNDSEPWVGNFAAYRLSKKFSESHLAHRFMLPVDSPLWTADQHKAIERSLANFKPEWDLPEGFSPWHALVLGKTDHGDEYFYNSPVVILSDAGCFSATDIFLGALEMLPQVTLLGTASSGGSARSQGFTLPISQIEVRCASMASFRPNGKLYDGNGIEIDEEIKPNSEYFTLGDNDPVLETAIRLLKKSH
ncbi:S41 family peptidase [Planctomycetota bacterium]|nr:S41 family peptidase [Planctomycetota bacterium]